MWLPSVWPPTSEIWEVSYVSPGNPADQMAVYGLLGGVRMERLIPWPGFGSAIFR
jgi:hypothetical protein